MAQFKLTYGKGSCEFLIPDGALAGPLLSPRSQAALPGEIKDVLRLELSRPERRPLLRTMAAGRKVGIIISDEFRSGLQHEILQALLEEVVAGNPSSIRVFCATGTHQPDIYAKSAKGWVEQESRRLGLPIEYTANDAQGRCHTEVGRTSRGTSVQVHSQLLQCDLRVYGHESKHHYLNGYSCIDKQVLPGMASSDTVSANHKLALHPDSGPGRNPWHSKKDRQLNPFAEDIREARELCERCLLTPDGMVKNIAVDTFGLDMVSEGKSIYWVRTGDPDVLCRELVPVVDRLMAYEVDRARYVIVSPGGPPASQALYGTQNCFDLALKEAILAGGEALVIAPLEGRQDLEPDVRGIAPDRRSKELFFDNLIRLLPLPLAQAQAQINEHFELYLWKTERVLRLMKGDQVRVHLHSTLDDEVVRRGGFVPVHQVQAWIDERVQRNDGRFWVIDQGNKLCVTAKN